MNQSIKTRLFYIHCSAPETKLHRGACYE